MVRVSTPSCVAKHALILDPSLLGFLLSCFPQALEAHDNIFDLCDELVVNRKICMYVRRVSTHTVVCGKRPPGFWTDDCES